MTDFPIRSRRRQSAAAATFWTGFLMGVLYLGVVIAVAKFAWAIGLGHQL